MSEEATVEANVEATVKADTEAVVEADAEANAEAVVEATADQAADQTADQTVEAPPAPEVHEELSYHAVQKDGNITAIWEMRGRKHIRTIDPRSEEGRHLLGPHDEPEAAH